MTVLPSDDLHIHARDLLAGFAGGLVNALVFGRGNIYAIISSMVVGALVANYTAEYGFKLTGVSVPTCAFIIGIGGMAIVQGIVSMFQGWRPKLPAALGGNGQQPQPDPPKAE